MLIWHCAHATDADPVYGHGHPGPGAGDQYCEACWRLLDETGGPVFSTDVRVPDDTPLLPPRERVWERLPAQDANGQLALLEVP